MAERRGKKPSAAELDLWRTVMRDAVPLRGPKRRPKAGDETASPVAPPPAPATAPPPSKHPTLAPPPAAALNAERLADLLRGVPLKQKAAVTVQLAPTTLGARSGIDKRTNEKVRRGRLAIDGRIDLHGLTQSEAHDALIGFVRRSHVQGRRLLLVITGKGGMPRGEGVLRSAVPRWLHETPTRDLVLAVHQAQPQHGGGGAYYVYLRRRRGE
ncbi:DNA mismatch repair protein MutS [Niveispirillum sp. SYP-B3756]|uniref:Smr/MutS family protein n=1 Tax=Niveispirillum sp. SYP-B3756 TaxID=2662178 RepID=UPI001291115B|nr:Smr/MutS family protein [Niveispirillum sp. SYP-B3756]MQP65709.1 DNA mismatch repair protein MutS [Niveispirillum sp. SYP-B3756]